MKRLIIYTIFLGVIACDKIESPVAEEYGKFDLSLFPGDPLNYYTQYYDIANPENEWGINSNSRGILLEDYTGHKCTNCPAAAQIAKDLEQDSNLNVIVASIHASEDGSFQSTDNLFTENYETEAGNEYVRGSEMSGFLGNPMGTINRNDGGISNSVWYFSSGWGNGVNNEMNNILDLNVQVKYFYFPSTNGLFIHSETSVLNDLNGNYHLVIYLIRNEVISPQKYNAGIIDTNYHHHAILSDNINNTWGTSIIDGAVSKDSMIYNNFSYQLPDPNFDTTYKVDNLSLITYIMNRDNMKVVQVIKTELE